MMDLSALYGPRKFDTDCGSVMMTKQGFKEECDVNHVVKLYATERVVPNYFNGKEPKFGDFTMASDLLSAMTRVQDAGIEFDNLPSAVRAVAGNSPVQLLEMYETAEGRDALAAAGLEVYVPQPGGGSAVAVSGVLGGGGSGDAVAPVGGAGGAPPVMPPVPAAGHLFAT